MQLHIAIFFASSKTCTNAFNAAEEAKLCSRPENYGRNPNPLGEVWLARLTRTLAQVSVCSLQ